MTNPSPDWLDDVLRSRPVADEGFSARVAGLGRSEVQTRWTVRSAIAVVVAVVVIGFVGFETFFVDAMLGGDVLDGEPGVPGDVWLDEHRAAYSRAVAAFDGMPALRRRSGRDASAIIDAAIARFAPREGLPPDAVACVDELMATAMPSDPPSRIFVAANTPRGTCDTTWIVGLSAYDEWRSTPENNVDWTLFLNVARVHLRRAAALPLVPGAPAPFAVAARDVEALGRLVMTHNGRGASFFETVAKEHERAAAAGRAGDHVVVVDAGAAELLVRTWVAGIAFASPAATDDDVAAIGRMQSVLACGALGDSFGRYAPDSVDVRYLDTHRVERVRALDPTGCARHRPMTIDDLGCGNMNRQLCRLLLAPAAIPPLRQRAVAALERIQIPRLDLALPTTTSTTTAVQP